MSWDEFPNNASRVLAVIAEQIEEKQSKEAPEIEQEIRRSTHIKIVPQRSGDYCTHNLQEEKCHIPTEVMDDQMRDDVTNGTGMLRDDNKKRTQYGPPSTSIMANTYNLHSSCITYVVFIINISISCIR